jgi:pimeloyl-ACP methyl ester carboxylesterase
VLAPFTIDVAAGAIDELRARLQQTRWPSGVTDGGGFDIGEARRLVARWRDTFDWPAQQARLNAYPQFVAQIGELRVHFVHVASSNANVLPLLLLHGWPGSFVEFLGVVDRLRDRFHLVVPSLPGFAFSSPAQQSGMSNRSMADVMVELMHQLGYDQFGIHGGDVGAGVASWLARNHRDRVVALHLNFIPGSYAPATSDDLSGEERAFLSRKAEWSQRSGAYGHLQQTRPLTLAYALSDSPLGLLAWIAEKFREWRDPASDISSDEVLTNVTIYWITNSIGSSVRLYLESSLTPLRFERGERVDVPCAIAHFPFEMPFPPRSWVERGYDVVRWTEMSRGGHFAALEAPDLLAEDLATFFTQRE